MLPGGASERGCRVLCGPRRRDERQGLVERQRSLAMPTGTIKNEAVLEKTVQRCREKNIMIPTFAEQRDPARVPEKIKTRLKKVGMQDVDPANLFRITWKNEPKDTGGLFNRGNWLEFPVELTGVKARI